LEKGFILFFKFRRGGGEGFLPFLNSTSLFGERNQHAEGLREMGGFSHSPKASSLRKRKKKGPA